MERSLRALSIKQVKITNEFWSRWQQVVASTVIPYQWAALNDNVPGAEPSGSISNFRIAAGEDTVSSYHGPVFQDSDLYKWLEATGYALILEENNELERLADGTIDLLGRAQQEDGYLDTYFTINAPDKRWTNLRDDHELYCAGHFFEAAVAYYQATGKEKVLHIARKLADHIAKVFGPDPGQKRGYPGHPEIELALVKLYRVTGERRYLDLSKFFIDERGQHPNYFELEAKERREIRNRPYNLDYSQSHLLVREQLSAEGHAVRAMYLFSGVVDIAAEYGDESLLEASRRLWNNVVGRRMYVTGGVGSSHWLEAFTTDYDLPNDTAYTETCAAVGLFLWGHRMLQADRDSQYADIMERALYNGVLSGIALDGKSYFYVNPLAVVPDVAHKRQDMQHVKTVRQPWFGCACCPPNVTRLLASLGQYMYSFDDNTRELYVHLYLSSTADVSGEALGIKLQQMAELPWSGDVELRIEAQSPSEWTLALRLPKWSPQPTVAVNGVAIEDGATVERGYLKIRRVWSDGDIVSAKLPMAVQLVRSHPSVSENAGKVAVQRGPLVYCFEEADNGKNLSGLRLSRDPEPQVQFEQGVLGGVSTIVLKGSRIDWVDDSSLYSTAAYATQQVDLKAIPYYAWANRGEGEMLVWVAQE